MTRSKYKILLQKQFQLSCHTYLTNMNNIQLLFQNFHGVLRKRFEPLQLTIDKQVDTIYSMKLTFPKTNILNYPTTLRTILNSPTSKKNCLLNSQEIHSLPYSHSTNSIEKPIIHIKINDQGLRFSRCIQNTIIFISNHTHSFSP